MQERTKKRKQKERFTHHPKMELWKKAVLALPIALSLSWAAYLRYMQLGYPVYGAELFAPQDTTPLMIALIIFTMGYIIFLLMMFSENIKALFLRRAEH